MRLLLPRLQTVNSARTTLRSSVRYITPLTHHFSRAPLRHISSSIVRMSGEQFSNADTGSKAADPYKEKNYQNNLSVKDKVEGLIQFIEGCKFGMMTTRQAQTGLLVSRCMALAGKVSLDKTMLSLSLRKVIIFDLRNLTDICMPGQRNRPHLPHQYRIRQDG